MKEHLDKYYTNKDIALQCCKLFSKYKMIDYDNDLVVEPSAGSGSFIPFLKKMCKNRAFIDIYPEHIDVEQKNFLKTTKNYFIKNEKINKIHVIGNPPFGFRSSRAISFIKHACTFCDTFCFILPKSFNKVSMKKTIPLNFHLVNSCILPSNAFHTSKGLFNIKCICQIWEKRITKRKKVHKPTPYRYSFVRDHTNAHFAIRRVGHHAGKIFKKDFQNKNTNTHYFVRLDKEKDTKVICSIDLRSNNDVTGPKSISKRDIILSLNNMLKTD